MAGKYTFNPYGVTISSPTGDVVLNAGQNITILPQGNLITLSAEIPPDTIQSVSNLDGTLTISPITGNVVASLALSHANNWTGQQNFAANVGINTTTPQATLEGIGTTHQDVVNLTQGSTSLQNVVPAMVSNTSPSGVASDSDGNGNIWNIFNQKDYGGYSNNDTSTFPYWVVYQFAFAQIITAYEIWPRYGLTSRTPKDFLYQGSNNGSAWTTLDTRTSVTSWSNAPQTFSFSNSTPYLYYRLYVTAINDPTYMDISKMAMFATVNDSGLYIDAIGRVGFGTRQTPFQANFTGAINLPTTTSSTSGVIYQNSVPFFSTLGTQSLFFGPNAGNFTFNTGSAFANIGIGDSALNALTTGYQNLAIGATSMINTTTGYNNTTLGTGTLHQCSSGFSNVAIGTNTLYNVTTGSGNTGIGNAALSQGGGAMSNNVAIGAGTLYNNTADGNIAIGGGAMFNCTTGADNFAAGHAALVNLTTGSQNIVMGVNAGASLIDGNANVILGGYAMYSSVSSTNNMAIGLGSMQFGGTNFSSNVGVGNATLQNIQGSNNAGIGYGAGATAQANYFCTFIGNAADMDPTTVSFNGNYSAAIGAYAVVKGSNQMALGGITGSGHEVSIISGSTAADASAKLQLDTTTQGFAPPRMTTTQKNAISSPLEGLIVYDLTLHKLYCYDGSTWQPLW